MKITGVYTELMIEDVFGNWVRFMEVYIKKALTEGKL